MARIISDMSSLVNDAREELRGGGETKVKAAEEGELKEGVDRWESAQSKGSRLMESLSSAPDRLSGANREITKAIAGPVHNGPTEAVEEVAQWFEPSQNLLDGLKSTRLEVQERVGEELQAFGSETIDQALEHALSPGSDLQERIEIGLHEIIDGVDSSMLKEPIKDLPEFHKDIQELDFEVRAKAADRVNTVLNRVAGTAAEVVADQRPRLDAVGGALQEFAEFGQGSSVEETILEVLGPNAQSANTATRWSLSAMGNAVEGTGQMAESFTEARGLPTRDNFEEWSERIEAGETVVVEGYFVPSVAVGMGGKAGGGGAVELARSEEEPNRMTLTIAGETEGFVSLGKEAQEQGATVSAGGRVDGRLAFDFDMDRPEHRELLADMVLAQQLGAPTQGLLMQAEGHLTQAQVGAETLGDVGVGVEGVDIGLESGLRGQLEMVQRADGPVNRVSAGWSGELSGGSFVQVPQSMIDEVAAAAPDEDNEKATQLLGALSGGRVGTGYEFEGELMAGMEFQDRSPQTVFVEGTVDAKMFGLNGDVDVELALHDIRPLLEESDLTAQEFMDAVEGGEVRLGALLEAAQSTGRDLEEVFGIKVTATSVDDDGFRLETLGLELGATTQRDNERVLFEMGTPIDRSSPPLGDMGNEAQDRLLERIFQG